MILCSPQVSCHWISHSRKYSRVYLRFLFISMSFTYLGVHIYRVSAKAEFRAVAIPTTSFVRSCNARHLAEQLTLTPMTMPQLTFQIQSHNTARRCIISKPYSIRIARHPEKQLKVKKGLQREASISTMTKNTSDYWNTVWVAAHTLKKPHAVAIVRHHA